MHTITLSVDEVSNSVYRYRAFSSDGFNYERTGDCEIWKSVINDLYRKYINEHYGYALFAAVSAGLGNYICKYSSGMFGSWSIVAKKGYPRIDYDGRDDYLMASFDAKKYAWQGSRCEIQNEKSPFFQFLLQCSQMFAQQGNAPEPASPAR